MQVPAQPLLDATAFGDQVVAVIDRQAHLALGTGEACARKVGLMERRPRAGGGGDAVGLAAPTAAPAQGRHQLGRNAHHLLAAREQEASRPAETWRQSSMQN